MASEAGAMVRRFAPLLSSNCERAVMASGRQTPTPAGQRGGGGRVAARSDSSVIQPAVVSCALADQRTTAVSADTPEDHRATIAGGANRRPARGQQQTGHRNRQRTADSGQPQRRLISTVPRTDISTKHHKCQRRSDFSARHFESLLKTCLCFVLGRRSVRGPR